MSTKFTLTFNVADIVGGGVDPTHVSGYVATNLPPGAVVVDTTNSVLHVGDGPLTIASNGDVTVDLLQTNATDTNVANWRYVIHLLAPSHASMKAGRGQVTATYKVGPFAMTGNATLGELAGQFETPAVPLDWRDGFRTEMQDLRDESAANLDAQIDLSQIATPDALIANRIETPGSLTAQALSATIDARVPGAVGSLGIPVQWVAGGIYDTGDAILSPRGDRLVCITAHTAATRFTDDLPKWRPMDAPVEEATLAQRARMSKGGGIGVPAGVAVFAIRYDDWHDAFNADIYPAHLARGLPAGFATISVLSEQPWAAATTPTTIKGWNRNGIEIHSHGRDHKDPSPHDLLGAGGLADQIITSRATIEGWGVKCQGWMQPGATPLVPGVTPYGTGFGDLASLSSYAAWLIRSTYPLSESYVHGQLRSLPTGPLHGLDHITVSDGMTLAAAKAAVDTAIARGLGVEFMCHAGNLGLGSNMTVAQYVEFLDYIVGKWDAGQAEVLTPSGLTLADRSTHRLNLIADGSFEKNAAPGSADPDGWGIAPVIGTIETTGGRTGSNFLRIPTATGNGVYCNQRPGALQSQGLGGETFVFEGWARSTAGTTSRVLIADYNDSTRLSLTLTRTIPAGDTWTRVRHAFTLAPETNTLSVGLGRANGTQIDWDDVSVRKV